VASDDVTNQDANYENSTCKNKCVYNACQQEFKFYYCGLRTELNQHDLAYMYEFINKYTLKLA